MKKTLSLFLAVIMIFSCFAILNVSAETGGVADMIYSEETVAASESALGYFKVEGLPKRFNGSLADLKALEGGKYWRETNLMGMSLDFLYSGKGALLWSELDVFKKDANGNLVYGDDGAPIMLISKDDISLAFTNISLYLQRVFYSEFGGLNLYNVENAIAMANFIGKAFNADFKELYVNNYRDFFTNEVPSANEFFKGVTSLSGLDKIINQNWLTRGKGFCQPVVELLGAGYIDFIDDYYSDGLLLGSKILEAMVKKMVAVGPVDFVYDLLNVFASSSYELLYRTPVLALFTQKIAGASLHMTEEKLNSFDGLIHLLVCDCDPVAGEGCYASTPENTDHFCFFDFPTQRFNSTTDKNERLIYIYYYLNICGRYRGNSSYVKTLQSKIRNDQTLATNDKIKLNALIDGFIHGDFDKALDEAIIPLYKENITSAPMSFLDRIKNAYSVMLKKIADYFDYLRRLFTGEIIYGQGNSPFN